MCHGTGHMKIMTDKVNLRNKNDCKYAQRNGRSYLRWIDDLKFQIQKFGIWKKAYYSLRFRFSKHIMRNNIEAKILKTFQKKKKKTYFF